MKIDQASFNCLLKILCHLPRQVDLPQFSPNSSNYFFPCTTEINREIPRVIPTQIQLQNHFQIQFPTQLLDLISSGYELIEKFGEATVSWLFGNAQSLRVADTFLFEFH